ncbi:major facilitator superfamily domain-containing protein [Mycena latifolia]|nr:major facilitator superfamily domain-containing protein [Mycena latifolia]
MGVVSMTRDLDCTEFQATVGFIVFTLGFGVVPLVSSSFSEEFGRHPLYIISALGFTAMYLLIALARSIQTIILARFIQGAFGSTWATVVGGTIADLWTSHEFLPMSIFALAALTGTGIGPIVGGWIEMNAKLEWRSVQWVQIIYCSIYSVLVLLVMRETRMSILLARLARKMRKETGDERYRARVEDKRANLASMIVVSCTRPIHLLLTEPVVSSFSLWIGFLWGVMFCMIASIPGLFQDLHDFNVGQEGTVFASIAVGAALGFGTNFYQEHLYRKHVACRGPEARLIMACAAAAMLPTSMFIYAWCAFPTVPWIALIIALVIFTWATFAVYLTVFSYLADCYGPFASSALAGQSLCRNTMATIFPLFTKQMFAALGYNWANTMFALIAAAMVPIPFVLFFFGPKIRMRSRFSCMAVEQQM